MGAVMSLIVVAGSAHAATATAIEFYNVTLKHYFITAYPEEAAGVDNGTAGPGWVRTGGQFTVYTDPAAGRVPVCRFYGTPGKGPNSHFYTANADECESVKKDAGWTFEAIAYYVGVPTPAGACPDGTYIVYRSYNNRFAQNDSNHRFTVDPTAQLRMPKQGYGPEGPVMCVPISDAEAEADAVRLLEQASLGPTETLVQEVKAKGPAKWIDEQLALNVTRFTQYEYFPFTPGQVCIDDMTPPIDPENYCALYKVRQDPVAWEFLLQSKTAPDQLRMRMGHVWHQILVVSNSSLARTYAVADFQQRLRDRAFSTYEDLLYRFSVSPQLGKFQNWIFNFPEHDGIKPNENYARELMQLFSVGVNMLDDDGTPKTDAAGRLVPAYTQADVATMARVLTGYGYPIVPGSPFQLSGDLYFVGDMLGFDNSHDQGAKSLFNGAVQLPANNGADNDVRAAIRAVINHGNAPAFLSKQLIQKTVTSNPSPAYVARISAVFKDNGKGVRGDLAALTRAILLDPEARGARKIDPEYGRLREPVLFWTAMLRALDVTTDGFWPTQMLGTLGQRLFDPDTVFSYYPADGTLLGSNLPAPEFGLFASSAFLSRSNVVNGLLFNQDGGLWGPQPQVRNAVGTPSPALTAFLPDAANPEVLVERLNRLFLHATMRAEMRKTILNAVNAIPASDPSRRVKMAVSLILVSIPYQVQK
jgi:uncharacterized protein (DUF1800 family)